MCGGAEDGALVILKDGQPFGDVRGVVGHDLGRDAKIGAGESAGQFRNQLLACIAFVVPMLAAKIPVKA